MKPLFARPVALLLLASASFASADYVDGGDRWAKPWKEVKGDGYVVSVNYAGDMSITVGGVTFSFGQLTGNWRGRNFSTHNNLHGIGPWSKVKGSESKVGDATVLKVEGRMTDLAITETLTASADGVVYRWQGKIVDPSPELVRINSYAGAFFTWSDKTLNPVFIARLHNGQSIEAEFRSAFSPLVNVRSFSFSVNKRIVRIDFSKARSVVIIRNEQRAEIPIRTSLQATGANPRVLMPGAVLEYEIKVAVGRPPRPSSRKR